MDDPPAKLLAGRRRDLVGIDEPGIPVATTTSTLAAGIQERLLHPTCDDVVATITENPGIPFFGDAMTNKEPVPGISRDTDIPRWIKTAMFLHVGVYLVDNLLLNRN
jgi:hypothetical protein